MSPVKDNLVCVVRSSDYKLISKSMNHCTSSINVYRTKPHMHEAEVPAWLVIQVTLFLRLRSRLNQPDFHYQALTLLCSRHDHTLPESSPTELCQCAIYNLLLSVIYQACDTDKSDTMLLLLSEQNWRCFRSHLSQSLCAAIPVSDLSLLQRWQTQERKMIATLSWPANLLNFDRSL